YVVKGVADGKLKELHKGPEINVEQTLLLKPDLILTFGMGNPKKDMNAKVLNAGIPAAISVDHLEETPLARAEWIKFVALFFGKERMADSLFRITEKNYRALKALADTAKQRPGVLTDMKYGDAWYVPGGDSYMSNMINDAGGNYIWKSEKKTGSIPLNFEAVYRKAKDADIWINLFMVRSKQELLGYEKRYDLFNAFKTGQLYNNNKVANKNGYSIYWEEGMCSPDEVLKDLISIFHPGLLKGHELKYYKKIE
ncbi:MAG: ABC transporter substrate-binding protein, partial [Bacteroidia bacterium]